MGDIHINDYFITLLLGCPLIMKLYASLKTLPRKTLWEKTMAKEKRVHTYSLPLLAISLDVFQLSQSNTVYQLSKKLG